MTKFKKEALVDREIEIGRYLIQGFSLKLISQKTGLNPKTLAAHIQNMMKKLNAGKRNELVKMLIMKNT